MRTDDPIAVVGAGFSGAVVAHLLAASGYRVEVFEARDHVAGNCHTERDAETGVMVHAFGPHIFHTSNDEVWRFVNSFGRMMPFTNRVKARTGGRIYSMPINLLTINQFFNRTMSPLEARDFIASIGDKTVEEPASFADQALKFLGQDLYEAFFRHYTIKQWGVDPSELPASILKRLPVRFNYDDNYYASRFQGIPEDGYTALVSAMLRSDAIAVHLGTRFAPQDAGRYGHVFYSGPLDAWFDHRLGRLGYRTLDFEVERHRGDFQGNAVINYCDADFPWTRISEHKHFAPWETREDTVIFKEYSRACGPNDTPYYPIRLVKDKELLSGYVEAAQAARGVTFMGRLGTYRYLDMHVAIEEAMATARLFMERRDAGLAMPAMLYNPLG